MSHTLHYNDIFSAGVTDYVTSGLTLISSFHSVGILLILPKGVFDTAVEACPAKNYFIYGSKHMSVLVLSLPRLIIVPLPEEHITLGLHPTQLRLASQLCR